MEILPFLPPELLRRIRRIVLLSFDRPVRMQMISAWSAWPDVSKRIEVQYPHGRKPLVGPMLTVLFDNKSVSVF